MRALEVVDLDLDAPCAGRLKPVDELDADRPAVLLEAKSPHVLAAHQPEVAVDVADGKAEGEAHRGRVDRADDAAVQRVGAVALVALDPIDIPGDVLGEADQLGGLVLPVPVGVEDPVPPRLAERRAQGSAVAAVRRMLDNAQPRLARRDLRQAFERVVSRAVVHHDDLPLEPDLVERSGRALGQARDRLGVVVAEQAGRDRVRVAQARAAQTRSTSSSVISG